MRVTGTVKFWDSWKGWGFITPHDGSEECFAHYSDLDLPARERDLIDGETVEFELEPSPKGPRAVRVRPYNVRPSAA